MPLPKDKGNIKIPKPSSEGGVSFEIKWSGGHSVSIPPLPDIEHPVHSFHDKAHIEKALKRTGINAGSPGKAEAKENE